MIAAEFQFVRVLATSVTLWPLGEVRQVVQEGFAWMRSLDIMKTLPGR